MRGRIEFLETSLGQANSTKLESAKEINVRTKFIKDMAMQLATERERIQKQVQHSRIIISLIFFLPSALKVELTTFAECDGH